MFLKTLRTTGRGVLTVMLRHSPLKSVVSMQLGCLCVHGNGRFDNGYVIQNLFSLPNVNTVQLNSWWEEIYSSNWGYCLDSGPNIQRMTDILYLIRLGQKHFFPESQRLFLYISWLVASSLVLFAQKLCSSFCIYNFAGINRPFLKPTTVVFVLMSR